MTVRTHDLVIVGTGVLGRALGVEATRLGLDVLCVGPRGKSPSFAAGDAFRLNTWTRGPDHHPGLSRELRKLDPELFPRASALDEAARRAFAAARVPQVVGMVGEVARAGTLMRVTTTDGRTLLSRRVLLCPGWGRVKNTLRHAASAKVLERALVEGTARDFTAAVRTRHRLAGPIAVVGAGPSALTVLEVLDRPVVWLSGGPVRPPAQPGLARMFAARYGEVLRRHAPTSTARVTRLARRRGALVLTVRGGQLFEAKTVVWCAGYEVPRELLGPSATVVLDDDGARLGLQRRGQPVFQVGPALDQLGLADWDLGPYAEWYEKGRRLLHRWSEASD